MGIAAGIIKFDYEEEKKKSRVVLIPYNSDRDWLDQCRLVRRVSALSYFRGDAILDYTLNQDRIGTCPTLVLCGMPLAPSDILL